MKKMLARIHAHRDGLVLIVSAIGYAVAVIGIKWIGG